jgi:hypothetical protein
VNPLELPLGLAWREVGKVVVVGSQLYKPAKRERVVSKRTKHNEREREKRSREAGGVSLSV